MPIVSGQKAELRVLNAGYTVGTGFKSHRILDDLSLSVRSGELFAMMGPSGAGKTTMLQLMTRQLQGGQESGAVLLNGEHLGFETFRRHAVYVEQYDTHWGYLTCRETMHYASSLSFTDRPEQQVQRAERMMERLGLVECADTKAGNDFLKGLSGGQRKRLALGVALLTGPVLMFLDEPTSGLDAASAASVTSYLKKVAQESNVMVVATIHQPSTDVFLSFDRVLFMANGREAYQGPTSQVASYCSSIGHPLPAMTNPADHFLMLVNSEFRSRAEVDKVIGVWKPSLRPPQEGLQALGKTLMYAPTSELESSQNVSVSSFGQSLILLRRAVLNSIRDPSLYLGRMATFLLANSFFALIYWSARDPKQDTADPRVRLLIWFVAVPSVFSVVTVYGSNDEFRLIRGEIINGLTRRTPYLIANFLCQIPYMFALSLSSLTIPWFIGLYPWDLFALAVCTMTAMLWTFESIGQLLGTIFRNAIVGMLAMVSLWFCCFLFMGVFLSKSLIAWPFRALVYALPLSWTVNGVVYAGIHPTIFAGAVDHGDGTFSCPNRTSGLQPCYGATGDQIMTTFNGVMSSVDATGSIPQDIGIILAIGALAKVLFVAVLLQKTRLTSNVGSDAELEIATTASDSSDASTTAGSDDETPMMGNAATQNGRGAPDVVFIGHPGFLTDIPALWAAPGETRYEASWWTHLLLPIWWMVGAYVAHVHPKLFGSCHMVVDDVVYDGLRVQTWIVLHFGRHFRNEWERSEAKRNVELAALAAERAGSRVLGLGAMNKAEFLNNGGLDLIPVMPQGRSMMITHGNHLTAAAVVQTVRQLHMAGMMGDSSRIFFTGASSKTGRAVAIALNRLGVPLLCHASSKERCEDLESFGLATTCLLEDGEACSFWIVGKYDTRVCDTIPKNAVACVFSVPDPFAVRGDRPDITVVEGATMHIDEARLSEPRKFANLLKKHEIFACHAQSIVLAASTRGVAKGRDGDELGEIDADSLQGYLDRAQKIGIVVPSLTQTLFRKSNSRTM
mmetsp:Transcript_84357/g.149133  ORF Transcript_84357/g.149133 Transcript_84357/m.149133 type:complete len:1017 (-) Transcript_84357:168-3218(-)|eukprot:CAMPEP_0197655164 /NCGR_PEP_ID=MMETSP1338-20131121/39288_1 /TAXON_ID=43686 ORGANISM="Pelagodinium beii, Strain RCC1491" /NCGR_SAMPLE_ID=MMETSP1338 /ASSEMBLY_ACC=CAM_ASM_000754 /LENGTH=1016 /DNA_ID=CAMNT_0043230761 /DNA_START=83 /DNA_END=3133 /DNA_ORIENTATION=-